MQALGPDRTPTLDEREVLENLEKLAAQADVSHHDEAND
jgi:hypothetical protein